MSEPALVFLLGESARNLRWGVDYEPSYANRKLGASGRVGKTRADLLLTAPGSGRRVLVEAKWWWRDVMLPDVLKLDRGKLSKVAAPIERLAVVFTVDAHGARGRGEDEGEVWDESGATRWMTRVLERSPAAPQWRLLNGSVARSRYTGTAYEHPEVAVRDGLFQAAFFWLVPR